MHDLIIRDALIVDGTGREAWHGDVAIDGPLISSVGVVDGRGRQELDAEGRVLAPGWVDVHTHYDGQVVWDAELAPSSWHGATTVVMGNCGVGFAPVRPGSESFLIELMEGVEDIPGTALHEGIAWEWESFDEYLGALASKSRKVDVVAQVPHAAVRAYVMGERAHDDPTPADIEAMALLVGEALEAGAAGFTTSRTILHRSVHGLVPGTSAADVELLAIAEAMGKAGHGVFQLISDRFGDDDERALMGLLAEQTGGPLTFSLVQDERHPLSYRDDLAAAAEHNRHGRLVIPQVANRPVGMLFGLESSFHPFIGHPTFRALATLPLAERVARLRDPEVRAALLSEDSTASSVERMLSTRWAQIFRLGEVPDYEPSTADSVARTAEREGRSAQEVALDWLLEEDGHALLFAPLANYAMGSLDPLYEMMTDPNTVLGLGDGGAHCGLICDASMPTYLLTHWVRDRTQGPKLELEQAVHLQTARTAALYSLTDRGVLEPGKRADLNLIDLEALRLHRPEMVHDLPAVGRRLVQRVDGYDATVVAGVVTRLDGAPTDELPGRLVRSR